MPNPIPNEKAIAAIAKIVWAYQTSNIGMAEIFNAIDQLARNLPSTRIPPVFKDRGELENALRSFLYPTPNHDASDPQKCPKTPVSPSEDPFPSDPATIGRLLYQELVTIRKILTSPQRNFR